jgi:hypothetical protein
MSDDLRDIFSCIFCADLFSWYLLKGTKPVVWRIHLHIALYPLIRYIVTIMFDIIFVVDFSSRYWTPDAMPYLLTSIEGGFLQAQAATADSSR